MIEPTPKSVIFMEEFQVASFKLRADLGAAAKFIQSTME